MKNLKLFVFALVSFMIISVTGVNAKDVATAEDFIDAVVAGGEVKVTENLKIDETIEVTKDVTIDLNGKTITAEGNASAIFNVRKGNFTLTGSGTLNGNVYHVMRIYGSTNESDKNYTVVTIGKDVIIKGNATKKASYGAWVATNNVDGKYYSYGVVVNINGELYGHDSGFCVIGTLQHKTNAPVININDGAVVEGIYAAGYANWNIGKVEIEDSDFGLGVKAGKFVIDGATITGTGKYAEPSIYNDGMNGTGSGIQIETNSVYADNIDITIKNATVTSKEGYAVLEYDGDTEIKNFVIENGTFTSASDKDVFSFTKNFKITNFIAGGTFSTDVKDYVKTGYVSTKVGDTYKVLKESKVTLGKVTAGNVKVDKTTALEGETVTLTLTPNEGYELSSIKVVDTYNKEVSVTGNTFVMPNSDVTITVVFTKVSVEIPVVDTSKDVKDVTVGVKDETKVEEVILDTIKKDTELASKIEDKDVTVEVEIAKVEASDVLNEVAKAMEEKAGNATIATYFDVTIALKDATGSINETISELSEEIELVVLLPEELRNAQDGMTRKYYIVREHTSDDKSQVDLIEAKLSEDGKYLVFKTNKFSTYAIAYEDVANVENPKTFDNVMLYVALGFMSVLVIGYSMNCLKKRKTN